MGPCASLDQEMCQKGGELVLLGLKQKHKRKAGGGRGRLCLDGREEENGRASNNKKGRDPGARLPEVTCRRSEGDFWRLESGKVLKGALLLGEGRTSRADRS